jgi:hypothetical protein
MDQKFNLKDLFFKESIILAAIPVLSYYAAYQYQVGYFDVFDAPRDLISVDFETLILFGSSVLLFFMFIYFIIKFISWDMFNLSKMSKLRFVINCFLTSGIVWSLIYFFSVGDWRKASIISFSFLLLYLILFLNNKYINFVFPQWLRLTILCIGLFHLVCHGLGEFQAKTQSYYTVITKLNNTFVIRKTGDYFLTSTYDIKTHTFSKSFRLLPIKGDSLDLEYKYIGPLHSSK